MLPHMLGKNKGSIQGLTPVQYDILFAIRALTRAQRGKPTTILAVAEKTGLNLGSVHWHLSMIDRLDTENPWLKPRVKGKWAQLKLRRRLPARKSGK